MFVVGHCIVFSVLLLGPRQEYTVHKKEVQETIEASSDIGVFHSLGKIIVEEGGHQGPLGQQNLQASLHYIKRFLCARSRFQLCFWACAF